jgi:aryl-alcohol dehydrogenase-like predicted oxidoreductase
LKEGKLVGPNDNEHLQPDTGFYAYRTYIEPPEKAEIVKRVVETTKNKGVTPTQVALARLFQKGVTAPIIGTTKIEQLEEAMGD